MSRLDPARFAAARAGFEELVELDPAARSAALATLRARDPQLAEAVHGLLAADLRPDGLLDQAAAEAVPELVERWLDGTPAFTALAPGDLVGGWRLVEPLGRGGMGEVWGVERSDGEIVQRAALKLLKRGMDSEEIVRRFRRERQIVARLEHPGIARLIDGGVAGDGRLYFVLERVDGVPITDAARGLDVTERIALVLDACDAVAAAHARLVVHRDLKPSNILVDAGGRVRLLDFGIAKLLDEDASGATALTRAETRPMTPGYAAPEQILGEPVTTATDVYALGAVLFELLVGRPPFRREQTSAAELAQEVERETAPKASRVAAESGDARLERTLAGDLDTILAKALARAPERRYLTVSAFADDLRRQMDGRPVAARPDRFGYRAAKFVGRHRAGVAAASVAALALVAGLAVSLVQTAKAERSADSARREAAKAERVRALLVAVFEASDPVVARGDEPTVRQLLAGGAERIERELASEPGLAGEMLDLLASLQRKLGALDEARRLAERSLALRSAAFGADSVEAAKSAWTLGWVLLNQGEFDTARVHLERAVARLDREGRERGAASVAAADAREPLVELEFSQKGPAAAQPLAEERLAIYQRELGDEDWRTGIAWSDVGVVLFQQGQLDLAESALAQAAAILDQTLPADDPRRAYPHNNLSSVYFRRGDLEGAERAARAAIELRSRALGPDHPETAVSIAHLVHVELALGRLVEAEAGARRALAIFTGKDPFNTANAEGLLAQALARQGRELEAVPLFDSAIARLDSIVGDRHILALSPRVNRAVALAGAGRGAEAKRELERLLPLLVELGDTGAETRARVESELARFDAR